MDRQAFKQRMQNLKSYRENNPGKGYWDWKVEAFADGGQTGDPEKERFYQATGRSSSGRPLEEGLKPVFSLEDAANMTPIGDAISARDTYNAVKNRDWLGAGLAALTVIPFVPNAIKRVTPIVRRTGTDQIDRILRAQNKEAKMATRYYLPDVIMPPSQDSYNIEDILSEDQINSIKLFEDKKYFTQEEAHEVIEFLIKRCYELGATKNY